MIGIIEGEVIILDVLGDTINFELRIMDEDLWVSDSNYIDLTISCFFFKERPFPYADTNIHIHTANMVKCRSDFGSLLVNQQIKVYVNVAAEGLVLGITIQFSLLLFLELTTSLSSGLLHLLDVIDHIAGARLIILLHSNLY